TQETFGRMGIMYFNSSSSSTNFLVGRDRTISFLDLFLGTSNWMDCKRHFRCCRYDLRFYSYLFTSAKLPSTSIPTVLCTNHTHHSCVLHCLMVFNSGWK